MQHIAVTQHAFHDQLHDSCVLDDENTFWLPVSWYFKHIHSLWSLSEIAISEFI
jgi:hypothetical protein